MPRRMNNETRLRGWKAKASQFLLSTWEDHENGNCVFVGTKDAHSERWREHAFELPVSRQKLEDFLDKYPRSEFDLYFCANPFDRNARKRANALPTFYACVDVDEAPLESFEPPPSIAWSTSPGRTQAIWKFERPLTVPHAEQIARNLAYDYGADRNGWSVTKYLRIPGTFNHKPQYAKPTVQLVKSLHAWPKDGLKPPDFVEGPTRMIRKSKPTARSSGKYRTIPEGDQYRRKVHAKHYGALTMMPRVLLGHDKVLYPDKSDAIFAMVAGLIEAGAKRREIATAVWNSVYFINKHGRNRPALEAELTRIIDKVGSDK